MDVPAEIVEEAEEANNKLMPEKSRGRYEKELNAFNEWRKAKAVGTVLNETVMLAYVSSLSKSFKASSLWTKFSMLKKALIVNGDGDISRYKLVLDKSALYNVDAYLVYSNKCKIPDIDPFNKDVVGYIKKKDFVQCAKSDDLVYITKNENYTKAFMHLNKTVLGDVVCHLSAIVRNPASSDNSVKAINRTEFTTSITLPTNLPVIVNCTNNATNVEVFANTYYPIIRDPKVDAKPYNRSITKKPFSVQLIGIDSVSRAEMIRSMPETRQYLKKHEWIEMLGYNKVGENTFPNLMPLLAGRNSTYVEDGCDSHQTGGLDKCNFIWKDYSNFGFTTLYVEGNRRMSTFNYQKKGFQQKPADYYSRPYFLAGAELKETSQDDVQYCVGPISETERILNVIKEAAVVFKNDPTFSIYWMNHAHSKMNSAGRYDIKTKEAIEALESAGNLNDTIIILFSDHGLRFGSPYVYIYPGQIESRLPFFFIYVPERFKQEHPIKYKNLLGNTNKLITPFDVHMTLQDILVLNTETYEAKVGTCEKSVSLFAEVPLERSCEDACIPTDFCLCNSFEHIDTKNETVQAAARFIVESIVSVFRGNKKASGCAIYKLDHVITAKMYVKTTKELQLLIVLKTIPEAVFESVITVDSTKDGKNKMSKSNEFSRLDKYGPHSDCVEGTYLKTLCYCEK